MIQGKLIYNTDNLDDVRDIRRKVFIEEQRIPEEIEMDALDQFCIHALAYDMGDNVTPVATGRIYFDGTECKIGRVAVLKEHRGQGYGDFIVRLLVNKALTADIHNVYLNAQKNTVDFYKKIGFIEDGEPFMEAGILHQRMTINPNAICGKCCKK